MARQIQGAADSGPLYFDLFHCSNNITHLGLGDRTNISSHCGMHGKSVTCCHHRVNNWRFNRGFERGRDALHGGVFGRGSGKVCGPAVCICFPIAVVTIFTISLGWLEVLPKCQTGSVGAAQAIASLAVAAFIMEQVTQMPDKSIADNGVLYCIVVYCHGMGFFHLGMGFFNLGMSNGYISRIC